MREGKRERSSIPHFIITRKQIPLGYIETKDIGSLTNLILTDYLEFRWYVCGQHRMTAHLTKVGAKSQASTGKCWSR